MKKYFLLALTLVATSVFAQDARYTIIIDAGSTGSRLHLFEHTTETEIPDIKDIFVAKDKTQPALATFAQHPENAGASLKKVLDDAVNELKKRNVAPEAVEVNVLATAGMRLLDPAAQHMIYANVQNYIQSHYTYKLGQIETIPGQLEGLYDWLDVNYLAKNFQQHVSTMGAIDLGGASLQIAFATEDANKSADQIKITIGKQLYHVFSKSFLGLGQDEARKLMNTENAAACYPIDYPINPGTAGLFNFNQCVENYYKILSNNHVAEEILPTTKQSFVAFSGVFYAYQFLGTETKPYKPLVDERTQSICNTTWEQLQKNYPTTAPVYLSAYCANSVYVSGLLYDSFKLQGEQLTVTDKIDNQEPAWPLGAMLYKLVQ